jgi:hypothetical protein
VRNRGPESKATNPDLQQQKRRSQRTSRQIQDAPLPAQPFPGTLVYAAGNIAGEDKESIYNSIHEFNNHPKIQKQCRLLEMSGHRFLQHSSSHGGGLSAKIDIPDKTPLCYYIGDIHDADHNPDGNQCMSNGFSGATALRINASDVPRDLPPGRSAQMINHGCGPNGEITTYVPDQWNNDLVLLVFTSIEPITKGTEVTF